MKCIICQHESDFLTRTSYENRYEDVLNGADMHKCRNCGFGFSKTLFDMDQGKWEELNLLFHRKIEYNHDPKGNYKRRQPPYYEQAFLIKVLSLHGVVDLDSMVDFGGGVGTLERILFSYYDISIPIYDPYMRDDGDGDASVTYINDLRKCRTVYNSAYFEHIKSRDDLDIVNDSVDNEGSMMIHTVVCENIPDDPNWFYFKPPVHSAFHTNKSMGILMEQWNYMSSLYCPSAKTWILFKKEPIDLYGFMDRINRDFQTDYLYYKKGFVDYWKGF
jgi:hypothetical protein